VKFVNGGEEGLDQGGLQKEMFQVAVQQLFDPDYGMYL
jgi:ubiquitin-protein ligase E3 A